jgi:hypothetical protein
VDAGGTLWLRGGTGKDTDGASPWAGHAEEIVAVKADGKVKAPTSCEGLFRELTKLESADLSGLDTSGATDVSLSAKLREVKK